MEQKGNQDGQCKVDRVELPRPRRASLSGAHILCRNPGSADGRTDHKGGEDTSPELLHREP